MVTKKTEFEYTKLAKFFYQRLENREMPLTAKNISQELLACAPDYRPGYWRRLRCALAYHQNMLGYVDAAERIWRAKNPVTAHGSNLSKRSRQPRARAINQADEDALKSYFNQRGDISMVSAILIFKNAGIRPAELSGLRVDGNRLIVTGAKKSHGGKRGADRTLLLDGIDSGLLRYCVMQAQRVDVGVMQDRLRAAGKNYGLGVGLYPHFIAGVTSSALSSKGQEWTAYVLHILWGIRPLALLTVMAIGNWLEVGDYLAALLMPI